MTMLAELYAQVICLRLEIINAKLQMIAPDAKPIFNRPPYKPIDVSGRKPPPPPEPSDKPLLHVNPKGLP